MLPNPIHPAIVHFPIALSVLLPLVAVVALLLGRRGTPIRTGWLAVVGGAALLVGSTWVALETGEDQEEKVEDVVGKGPVSTHAGRAETFFYLTAGTLVLAGVGLAKGRLGQVGRVAGTVATLVLVPAGYLVGHSGGELVYKHGAAQAYLNSSTGATGEGREAATAAGEKAGDKDDDRE